MDIFAFLYISMVKIRDTLPKILGMREQMLKYITYIDCDSFTLL